MASTPAFRALHLLILSILVAALLSSFVFAQVITATILGTVRDPSGAVVPGAKATAINVNTGLTRSVISGDSGDYTIPVLPLGEYRVRVEKGGFRPAEQARVQLTIDSRVRVDFELALGDLAQEVQVTGESPLVDTESSAMGQVIENRAVEELPLNGRQFVQLAMLTPNVAPEVKGTVSSPLALSGFSFSANGTRYDSNMFLLDGVSIRDSVYARLAVSPSVDAIQEFKVHTSNYSAEFGSQGGAQVNISTKSGTNSFHGSVYEFLRNDVFDARNFFDRQGEKPPFRLNQFGASLGGPIIRGKTFFFGNYEGQRTFKGVTIGAAVPTEALRQGDFSGVAPILDPVNGVPFANDQIPSDRIAPYAQALLEKIPLPTSPGLGRNFLGFGNRDVDLDQFTVRVDHSFDERNLVFGRFVHSDISDLEPIPGVLLGAAAANPLRPPGFGQTTTQETFSGAFQYNRIFGTNLVNQFRFGYLDLSQGQFSENADRNFVEEFGFQGVTPPPLGSGFPVFSIAGFSTFGDANTQLFTGTRDLSFHDVLAWTKGKHALRLGGEYTHTRVDPQFGFNYAGQYTYVGVFTGHPFADFLLGFNSVANALIGDPLIHGVSYRLGAYVQDDWRVAPKLTLNLGVRYDLTPPYRERDNKLANFAPEIGGFVVAGDPNNIHPSADFARFPGVPFATSAELGYPTALAGTDYNNISPRIGFAYSPIQSLVLRGGYGTFYSTGIYGGLLGIMGFNPPFTGLKLFLNFDPGNLIPVQQSLVSPSADLVLGQGPARDLVNALTHQWNFSAQHELFRATVLELAYVGSRGTKLEGTLFPNQPDAGTGDLRDRLRWPNIGPDQIVATPVFDSWYNAMVVRLEQRYAGGLQFNLNYTWAKSLDNGGGSLSNASGNGAPQFSGDINAEKGRSQFDVRHRFAAHAIYELPFGRGRRFAGNADGFANALISGWQLANIIVAESGQSMTPLLPIDQSNTGVNNDRPNQVGDPNAGPRTPDRWFNVDAYEMQPFGTFGNAARGGIDGPGYFTVDLSAIKNTKLTERLSLQFRAEAFNLFNRANFDLPSRVFGTPGFGQIFTAKEPRELQFAIKLLF